jgi:hypothetical protein
MKYINYKNNNNNKYNYIKWWLYSLIIFSIFMLMLQYVYKQTNYLYIETISPCASIGVPPPLFNFN